MGVSTIGHFCISVNHGEAWWFVPVTEVRQSNMRKFTAEFLFSFFLCVALRLVLSLQDLWILFSPAPLFLSVFGKTSMALGNRHLLSSGFQALRIQA